jgi:arylsulfatase A-like enzyme
MGQIPGERRRQSWDTETSAENERRGSSEALGYRQGAVEEGQGGGPESAVSSVWPNCFCWLLVVFSLAGSGMRSGVFAADGALATRRSDVAANRFLAASFPLTPTLSLRERRNRRQSAVSKPNVILVLADQWRAQAFGYAGDPNAKTPNLDQLARESFNFVNAIAGVPVCCPTRASLLTGRRPLSTGVFLNDVPLAPGSETLAKVLRDAGYDTAYIGKWHLNGDGRSSFIPRERRQGFDYWKALECTHDYNHSFYYADGPEKLLWQGYDAIAQTQDARGYLRAHARSSKPFLLVLAWGPPHDPYNTAPEKYRAMFSPAQLRLRANVPEERSETTRARMAGYYAHCSALDDCLGELRAALKETGADQDTLLIFTSDHGDLLGSHGGWNKQQPYDESIRVPLLIHGVPGAKHKARKLDALINSEDIMPTILGLCGVSIPQTVEGLDYSGYIRGGKNPSDGATVISCVAPFGQWTRKMGGREYRGLRTLRYTYVRGLKGPWLLFDNREDPAQLKNLVGLPSSATVQKKLDDLLRRKLAEAHDEFLPAEDYIQRWGYTVDANSTVPYEP